jgi:hypothetical protein
VFLDAVIRGIVHIVVLEDINDQSSAYSFMCSCSFRKELRLLRLAVPRPFLTDPEVLTASCISFQLYVQRSVFLDLYVGLTAVGTHMKVIWTPTLGGGAPVVQGMKMLNHVRKPLCNFIAAEIVTLKHTAARGEVFF